MADRSFAKEEQDEKTIEKIDKWFSNFEEKYYSLYDEKIKLRFDRKNYDFFIDEPNKEPYNLNQL